MAQRAPVDFAAMAQNLTQQLNLRVAVADVERLDAVAAVLASRMPGIDATRSSAARAAMLRGLELLESELGLAPSKKPRR